MGCPQLLPAKASSVRGEVAHILWCAGTRGLLCTLWKGDMGTLLEGVEEGEGGNLRPDSSPSSGTQDGANTRSCAPSL